LADSNGQGSVRRRVTVARWVEQETLDVRLGGVLLGDKRSSTDEVRRRVRLAPYFLRVTLMIDLPRAAGRFLVELSTC
jgi:hypothetical protein